MNNIGNTNKGPNQTPGKKENGEPHEGRRNFLGGLIAGAVGLAGVNKFIVEPEKEKNDFYKKFEGREHMYDAAVSATQILLSEMNIDNLHRVAINGTGRTNYRVEILRDFLTTHLNLS